MLRNVIHNLSQKAGMLLSDLSQLEMPAKASLEFSEIALVASPLNHGCMDIDGNVHQTEEYSHRLITSAQECATALKRLKCSLKVVDSVFTLHDVGSSIASSYDRGDVEKGREYATAFIAAINIAKADGYWDELSKVLNSGYVGHVIASLRSFVINRLSRKMSSEESQLFMRLAVALQASSDAYLSYLKTIHDNTESIVPDGSHSSQECYMIEKVILTARNLLLHQAKAVHSELGSAEYIRICREIHSATSSRAVKVLHAFIQGSFTRFISTPDASIEEMLPDVSRAMDNQDDVYRYIDDVKNSDRVLDDIASISSIWIGYEGSLREMLNPVYRKVIANPSAELDSQNDVLGGFSKATQAIQSLLLLYVRLEYVSVKRGLMHAINCDSIVLASPEEDFAVMTSTLVDDVFFVLQRAQQRAVSTGDIQAACATLNQVNGIIQVDLKNVLTQNLMESQAIYKKYIEIPDKLLLGNWYNMLEEHFTAMREPLPESLPSQFSFLHCMNNIEECLNFFRSFKEEISNGFKCEFGQNGSNELLVESTLESMDVVVGEYEQLLETTCKHALSILKFHLTDTLNTFNDIDFSMSEHLYTSQQETPFAEAIVTVLKNVVGHLSGCYSPASKSICINNLIERICKFIEAGVLHKRFSLYGALYLEDIVRSLMQLCTSYDEQAQKHFVDVLCICDILNCSSEEELMQLRDKHSPEVVDSYIALRVDYVDNHIT